MVIVVGVGGRREETGTRYGREEKQRVSATGKWNKKQRERG